jgi:plasmid stabilization system protein ParE
VEEIWTEKAETSFNGVVDYLLDICTAEIVINFVDIVEHTIGLIVDHPEMFKVSEYDNQSMGGIYYQAHDHVL